MDTQTKCPTSPSCFPFFKGLPPKQPEGFGCFVCPNLILQVRNAQPIIKNSTDSPMGSGAPGRQGPLPTSTFFVTCVQKKSREKIIEKTTQRRIHWRFRHSRCDTCAPTEVFICAPGECICGLKCGMPCVPPLPTFVIFKS